MNQLPNEPKVFDWHIGALANFLCAVWFPVVEAKADSK